MDYGVEFKDLKGCKKHKQEQVGVLFQTRPIDTYCKNYAEIFVALNFHFIKIVMLFHNI